MLPRRLRAAIFCLGGSFIVLGPIETQVLLRPMRSNEQPWRPMAWQMYHMVGLDLCQATFWSVKDGQRVDIPKRDLEQAIPRVRMPGKYNVGHQVRDRDVLWNAEAEFPELARSVCATSGAEVHAVARCSPGLPGGRWKQLEDGSRNLCP